MVDHIVLPNDLTQKITGEKSPEAAAEALWHKERHVVVITCGIAGCWFLGKDEVVRHQPAFEVQTVDTTGCGDIFHGAYAAALAQGATLCERVRLATAAADSKRHSTVASAGYRREIRLKRSCAPDPRLSSGLVLHPPFLLSPRRSISLKFACGFAALCSSGAMRWVGAQPWRTSSL